MNILVTGGAGYIGSVLVPKLLFKGYNVTVLDNFMYKQHSLSECCKFNNFKLIVDDVRNENLLYRLLPSYDIIIPLAAIVGAPACDKDKDLSYLINQRAIEFIVKMKSPNQKLIYPNTNSGYGIGENNIYCDEDSNLNPISLYGKQKMNAESYIRIYENYVSLRLATVFGVSSRMRLDLLVNEFVYKALNDKYIVLYESHFKRNYIHIQDVTDAIMFFIENDNNGIFNVGLSDANISKLELCETIKKHVPDFYIHCNEYKKDVDQRNYIVSNKKIENLGFKCRYSLDDGIEELIKYYTILKQDNRYSNI